MSTSPRLGGNAPGLPGGRLTRRGALRGAAAAVLTLAASATAQAAPLHAGDARLIELTDAFEAAQAACEAHMAAHRDRNTPESDDAFDALSERFSPIEAELAATPADTLAGVVAKARVFQVPTMRQYLCSEVAVSLADDVWRLFGGAVA